MDNLVILVDENDTEVGTMHKLAAHEQGKLHRAFSIFIFHPDGRLMLQKRANDKYHSGGLWTNTCCSHPRPGESVMDAAHNRLKMEMGFDCTLSEVYTFMYRVEFDNGLIEHEYDHVVFGMWSGDPKPNAAEVSDWKLMKLQELKAAMGVKPSEYTYWFRISFDEVERYAKDFLMEMKLKAAQPG